MDRRLCFVVLTICLAFAAVVPTAAQAPPIPQRLSLDEAVRLAAARNPQAAAARTLVAIAEANRVDARLRPNPAVSVESESYPLFESPRPQFFDGQELTIRFDQEIETTGRRRLRTEAAEAGVAVANLTARDRFRQLELAVRRAFLQLALAQADANVARASLEEIDRVLMVGGERVRVGEAARSEVSRLQVERLRFAEDAFAADLSLRNARAALLTLLGASDLTQPLAVADSLEEVPVAVSTMLPAPAQPATVGGRPDLLAAHEELRRAETETRLQRALRAPNITIGGGYRRDFGTNAVVLGLTLLVPLWSRNQGGLARGGRDRRPPHVNATDPLGLANVVRGGSSESESPHNGWNSSDHS